MAGFELKIRDFLEN